MSTCLIREVKEIIDTSLSETMIKLYIDSVEEKVGKCVDASYDAATAKLIKLNLVAYMIYSQENKRQVSSKRAPNGASVTYETSGSESGIDSNEYGRTVKALDTNGCFTALIPANFGMYAVGKKNRGGYERSY